MYCVCVCVCVCVCACVRVCVCVWINLLIGGAKLVFTESDRRIVVMVELPTPFASVFVLFYQ
jgi:hypothetical protein